MPASNRPRKYRGSGMQGIRDSIANSAKAHLSRLRKQLATGEISRQEYFSRLRALKAVAKQGKEEYP